MLAPLIQLAGTAACALACRPPANGTSNRPSTASSTNRVQRFVTRYIQFAPLIYAPPLGTPIGRSLRLCVPFVDQKRFPLYNVARVQMVVACLLDFVPC